MKLILIAVLSLGAVKAAEPPAPTSQQSEPSRFSIRKPLFPPSAITDKFDAGIDAKEADHAALQRAYTENNRADLPLVSWMLYGFAKLLLYSDGSMMAADAQSKSKLVGTRLSGDELRAAIDRLSREEAFWALEPHYKLSRWTHQPLNIVTLRIPGKPSHSVSVYGLLDREKKEDLAPPTAFKEFLAVLAAFKPQSMLPWDPGYVEILWADYDYAPERSIIWPSNWPSFESPLVRPMENTVIKKIMIFPSDQIDQLDAFLAQRLERGAILISGRKMSASYRWPMRGEKKWSSWNQ